MRIFLGVLAVFVIVVAPGRSDAQTAASEIKAYRNVTITFSENADECNLSDDTIFKQKIREKLAGAGIRQSDASRVTAGKEGLRNIVLRFAGQKSRYVLGSGLHDTLPSSQCRPSYVRGDQAVAS